MEFTLFYKGKVTSKGTPSKRVHPIRQEFHKQLKELWLLPPLDKHKRKWLRRRKLTTKVGAKNGKEFRFVFLVTKDLEMYASLDVKVLYQL